MIISKQDTNDNGNHEITIEIDGNNVASIEYTIDFQTAAIEDVNVDSEFQGRGFYTILLIAVLNQSEIKYIISDNRNDNSNPIYQHWLNDSDLDGSTPVEVEIENESLSFNIL